MSEEKQFEASQKKKNKAREDGQIPRSRELTQSVQLSVCFLLLLIMKDWGHSILDLYHKIIENIDSFNAENIQICIADAGKVLLGTLVLWFGVLCVVSLLSEFFQLREFRFSFKLLVPSFDRLDPVKGFKRLLGEREGMKMGKGLCTEVIQMMVLGGVALFVLWFRLISGVEHLFELELHTAREGVLLIQEMVFELLRDLVILSLAFGMMKYFFSVSRIRKQLMMDFNEMKQEVKEQEGDPHVKGQRKSIHQEVLLNGMIENVKKAKVVVVSDS